MKKNNSIKELSLDEIDAVSGSGLVDIVFDGAETVVDRTVGFGKDVLDAAFGTTRDALGQLFSKTK